jgi:hypothetical protein
MPFSTEELGILDRPTASHFVRDATFFVVGIVWCELPCRLCSQLVGSSVAPRGCELVGCMMIE